MNIRPIASLCRRARTIITVAALLAVTATAAANVTTEPQYGGDYRAPLAVEPLTLDPARLTDIYSINVATNVFDGLLAFNQKLDVTAAIARRWKISRDHRTYTFQLRRGVTFHNGREVTAEDFIFSFSRILDPDTESPLASSFLKIKGAKTYREGGSDSVSGLSAPTPYTLKIELDEPFAPFLSILAMVNAAVVPKEATGSDFGRQPLGTGPFQFRAWTPGESIELDANQNYFAGRPFVDRLRFRIYSKDDWEGIFADFQRGLLDHARVPKEHFDAIAEDSRYQGGDYDLVSRSGLNIVYVGINTAVPPFDDVRVRQALNYAVDAKAIVNRVTRRGANPATGILPPGVAGFDPDLQNYPYDPAKARALLAEAGFADGAGLPALELWTASKANSVQAELREYQRYLAAVGLRVEIKTAASWQAFIDAINGRKAALFYAAWYADYPDPDNFFYPLVYSQSTTNRTGFSDPRVDELLRQARTETDYIKRTELYQTINKLVMQGAPTINQHNNGNSYLFGKWVRGGEMSPLGINYFPIRQVWIDQQQRQGLASTADTEAATAVTR